jgi:hypothetical protein
MKLLSRLHDVVVHLGLLHSNIILLLPLRAAASLEDLHKSKDGSPSPENPAEGSKDDFCLHSVAGRSVASCGICERFRHHDKATEEEDGIQELDHEMDFRGRSCKS